MKKHAKIITCILLVLLAISPLSMLNAKAAETGTETLYLGTEYGQTEAREMLDMINEFRTDSSGGAWYWNSDNSTKTVFNTSGNVKLGELKYDYELEKAAMQRAAEIAVAFSHTRPDGSSCFTVFPSGYNYRGENIAAGYGTAEAVFIGWREDNDAYAGQGHRRNMLNPNFNAIGIGHAYVNGYHFWVQELGYTQNTTTKTTANDAVSITEVTVDSSKLTLAEAELSGAESYTLKAGETVTSPDVVYYYDFEEHWPNYTNIISFTPTNWISSNKSVAYVENGRIKAVGEGEAVLTAEGTDIKVNVAVTLPIKITKQPVSVTVASGKRATVSVTAEGEGLTYQWWIANKGYTKFSKSSTTTSSYSVDMDSTRDGRRVYCIVKDKYGNTVQTNTVTISMTKQLTITKQPVSVTVASGKRATVTVTAEGEGLTYQWWIANKGYTKFSKSSTTTSSYSVDMDSTRDGRRVYCIVKDKYGNTVQTNTVTISMTKQLTITKQPVSVTVASGKRATVTVTAEGEGLTYQWWIANKGYTKFSKSSTTTSSYSVDMDSTRDGRRVYCIVKDKYGNTVQTNTVTISMTKQLTITKQPVSVTVASGKRATVTVTAEGEGLTYQWWIANKGYTKFSKSSTTTSSYSVDMDSTRDGRRVYCIVKDKYGNTVQTNIVTINMK